MQPSELRIGNLVKTIYRELGVLSITQIRSYVIYSNKTGGISFNSIVPIPITEKWLIDLGFSKNRTIHLGIDKSFNSLQITNDLDVLVYDINRDFVSLKKIRYVHELQNLYFAFTGKELEYNAN